MKIWKHQFWHFLLLVILLMIVYFLCNTDAELLKGSLWNIFTKNWLAAAVFIPVVHQIYVLICWRSELYYQSISKFFGKKEPTLELTVLWGLIIFTQKSIKTKLL